MQDLNDKATGQSLTAAEWNQVPSEIQNVIQSSGITLSGADLNQLGKALTAYVSNANVYTSSGSANAYTLTPLSGRQAPQSYYSNMIVKFVPNISSNAGAVTVNVAGLGIRNVVSESGSSFTANNEFRSVSMVTLRYDSIAGNFKLVRIPNASIDLFGLLDVASQTEANNGTGTGAITSAILNSKTATETRRGIAETATQIEVDNELDDERIVTALKLGVRLGQLGTDDINNDSTIAGTTLTDAIENLVSLGTQTARKTADQNITSDSLTSISGLNATLNLSAGTTYQLEGYIHITDINVGSTVSASGFSIRLGFTDSNTNSPISATYLPTNANSNSQNRTVSFASNAEIIVPASTVSNNIIGFKLDGIISPTLSGLMVVQMRRETSSGGFNVKAQSYLKITEIP